MSTQDPPSCERIASLMGSRYLPKPTSTLPSEGRIEVVFPSVIVIVIVFLVMDFALFCSVLSRYRRLVTSPIYRTRPYMDKDERKFWLIVRLSSR
jgi:hypothetical protein